MLRDRETIKWTSLMLPEHLTQLKQDLIDVSKIEKPSLVEQQIEEMNILVSKALEFNKELQFKFFNNGFVENVAGRVHYINCEQQKLHVIQMKKLFFSNECAKNCLCKNFRHFFHILSLIFI